MRVRGAEGGGAGGVGDGRCARGCDARGVCVMVDARRVCVMVDACGCASWSMRAGVRCARVCVMVDARGDAPEMRVMRRQGPDHFTSASTQSATATAPYSVLVPTFAL